jgi:hypothetical protein
MVTVGYGDITPSNSTEIIVAIFSILLSCGIFAFSLNKIGSILEEIKSQNRNKNQMLKAVNLYMQKKNINYALRYHIREYVEYYYENSLEEQSATEEQIFRILSEPL